MPNHTTNVLTVDGSAHEVARFIEENKTQSESLCEDEQNLTFEASFPTPPELLASSIPWDKKKHAYSAPDWYEWRVANWGTKWDCYDVEEWVDNTIRYFTAWSPATNFYLHVSLMYPDLTFHHAFADEGAGFLGEETIKEGKIEDSYNYDWDSEAGIALRDGLGVYYPEDED